MRLSRNGRCVTVKHGLPLGCTPLAPQQLERTASSKPPKGEFLLERRGKSRSRVTAEQKVMREAVRLDGHRCRYPKCAYRDIPIDACHVIHRGMGGNPKLDRTTLESIFAGCRIHHGQYDRGEFDVRFMVPARGTRGLMSFVRTEGQKTILIGVN